MKAEHLAAAKALASLTATHAGRTYLAMSHVNGCPFVIAALSDSSAEIIGKVHTHLAKHPMVSVVFMRSGELDGLVFERGEEDPNAAPAYTHADETLQDFIGRMRMHNGMPAELLTESGVRTRAFA